MSLKIDNSRRRFLTTVVALPAVSLVGAQSSALAGGHGMMLSVDDPTAKALGYVEVSSVAGKNCENCNLYTGAAGEKAGPCAIFPGKKVTAAGYCNSWIPKI